MQPQATTALTLAQIIQEVLLKDEAGRVQAIIPANRLLDLNKLNQQLERQLQPLTVAERKQLKQRGTVAKFPQPSSKGSLLVLVDNALLEPQQLYMRPEDSSNNNGTGVIAIDMAQFEQLKAIATVTSLSVALPSINHDHSQDIQNIHNALNLFTTVRIKQRLAETLNLPPLPEVANRIIELRTDRNAGPQDLAKVAELDPGLSAQIINWARSPYYGIVGDIKTIEEAVVRVLGFDLVINLALGLALGKTLSVPKDGPHGYAPFWQQSVITAMLCSELIKNIPARLRPDLGISYLCGLLHNFGFLILGHVFPPQFALVNRHIEANPHINRSYLEQHLLGITREQIASSLLEQWHMPEEVVFAIRQQHNPKVTGTAAPYAQLLYVATRALRQQGYGDGPLEPIKEYVLDDLGLNAKTVKEITAAILARTDEFNSLALKLSA